MTATQTVEAPEIDGLFASAVRWQARRVDSTPNL